MILFFCKSCHFTFSGTRNNKRNQLIYTVCCHVKMRVAKIQFFTQILIVFIAGYLFVYCYQYNGKHERKQHYTEIMIAGCYENLGC